ncbi:MAG: hypothetical protein H6537_05920 [Bacteroidales bacterium]|nr:hypothetical protein [Bacteroidales bacterium]HRX32271.1 hypothetical protein [Tenuifilaceae bacterium]
MITIGIIIVVIIILPLVLSYRSRLKKEHEILHEISRIANQHNCTISKQELCGDFAIGIDTKNKFVFFKKKNKFQEYEQLINLADIKSCTINNGSKNDKALSLLCLVFKPITKDKPDIELEFYNANSSRQLSGELQSIETWHKLINEQLSHSK